MSDPKMIDEDELFDLFAPHSPNPDRIASGIAERLDPDTSSRDEDRASSGNGLSKAAAWLPIPLKGSKLWLWLSMPMLLLASVFLSFAGAASSIRSSVKTGPDGVPRQRPKRSAMQSTNVAFGIAMVGAAMLLPLLGWYDMLDTLLVACLVSMLSLTHLVRKNVAMGYGDRQQIAAVCVSLLDGLLIITLVYTLYDFRGTSTGQWGFASPITLAIGTLAFVRYAPMQSISAIAVAGYFVFLSQGEHFRPAVREVQATLPQVLAFVEQPDLEARDTRMPQYRSIVLALRAAGENPEVPNDLWDRVSAPISKRLPRDAFALSDCSRADLVPQPQWQVLSRTRSNRNRIDKFLTETGPVRLKPYHEYLWRLVAARDLPRAERNALRDRILASWPASSASAPLTTMRLLTAGLDLLGFAEVADQQRASVHAALVRTQLGGGVSAGGFSEADGLLKTTCNDVAMALMARFGVPEALDLHSLRAHLERESMLSTSKTAVLPERNLESYAHLLQFDKQVGGLPDRTLWRVIVDERLLWSMIAMVLLCIYTVRLTPPRSAPVELRGAMP